MKIVVREKNVPSEKTLEAVKKKIESVFDKLDIMKYNVTNAK